MSQQQQQEPKQQKHSEEQPKTRSGARLQYLSKQHNFRSSHPARKILVEFVKEMDYSVEKMDQLWIHAMSIATDSGKKTVQERDINRVIDIARSII